MRHFIIVLVLSLLGSIHYAHAATLIVTDPSDNAGLPVAGSLRERYNAANANDVIVFAANLSPVIELVAPLFIAKSISIDGTSYSNGMTVSGAGTVRPILVGSGVTVTLTGFTIAHGFAGTGGGGIENGGNLTLERMTLTDNVSSGGNNAGCGGGICNQSTGNLVINNSSIIHNVSLFCGGGIGALDGGTLTVTSSLVAFNRSSNSGGGICVRTVGAAGTTTLTNVTITENRAGTGSGSGDGVALVEAGAGSNVATVRNCTIAYNTGSGWGLVTTGTMSVANTIAYGNSFPDLGTAGGVATSLGNNLYGTQSGLTGTPSDSVGDPRLSQLGSYGGSTQTYALLPGSPAINAGTSTGAPSVDQRGITRASVDIGAFESRGFTLTLSGNNQRTLVSTAYPLPLGVRVASAFGEPVMNGRITLTPPGSGARLVTGTASFTVDLDGDVSQSVTANAVAGTFSVGVSAAGAPTTSFSLTNLTAVSLSPVNVANTTAADAYSQTFTTIGGTPPYTYVVSAGSLPPGLSLSTDGTLSGTPTTAGTFGFNVTVEDSNVPPFTAARAYSLTVGCPAISVSTLPNGIVGAAYSAVANASPPASYVWDVASGALPAGVSLGPTGGLSGVAMAPTTSAFNLRATAFGTCSGEGTQSLQMACAQCEISGSCVAAAALDPLNDCAACDPFASVSTYSPRQAGVSCASDGLAYTADRCDGAGTCVHEPLGLCEIDGVVRQAGEEHPTNPCLWCAPAASKTAWSPKSLGAVCADDGLSCTSDVCDANGSCTHPLSTGCIIAGACVAAGELACAGGANDETAPESGGGEESASEKTPGRTGCRSVGDGMWLFVVALALLRRKK